LSGALSGKQVKACRRSSDMATVKKLSKKKTPRRRVKSGKPVMSTIVTVRVSDEEKKRIDGIMTNLDIKRYSDVMRLALQMMRPDLRFNQVSLP
jgi:hypothetical protein